MSEQSEKQSKNRFRMSFTPVLTIVVLAITALTAAYVGGVMSGRHLFRATEIIHAPDAEAEPQIEQEGILKPGELEFAHVLRGEAKPPGAMPRPEEPPVPPKKEAQEVDMPDKPQVEVVAPTNSPESTEQGQKDESSIVHDYIFQLAALKDPAAVDALRERLEGHGLRTRLERNGKLFLVLVYLRGTDARAAEVIDLAKGFRLGEPLMRSKKPVSQ